MTKITINAKEINQGDRAGKKIITSYRNNKPVYAKSHSKCRHQYNADPSYHPWEPDTLSNFIHNGSAQCGRGSRYHCDTSTIWDGIKGYRNICPIAGLCGMYNTPAALYLSRFNLQDKGINQEATVNKFTFIYEHGMVGVDVATGAKKKNWAGLFPYVDISLYYYDVTTEGGHIGNLIQTKRFNTKIPTGRYGTVSVTFDSFDINPSNQNLVVQIQYPMQGDGKYSNAATNPSIIYIKGLDMQIDYTNKNQPVIDVVSDTISSSESERYLITDKTRDFCRTTVTHLLQATNKTSHANSRNIYVNPVTIPAGMSYTESYDATTEVKKFVWTDSSGVFGYKNIEYCLKSNNKIVTTLVAVAVIPPQLIVAHTIKNFTKGSPFSNKIDYISVDMGCFKQIELYIDSINNEPIIFNRGVGLNLLNIPQDKINCQEKMYNAIKDLPCGAHKLFLYRDWEYLEEHMLYVIPQTIDLSMDYQFYIDEQPYFIQSQRNAPNETTDDGTPTSNSYLHQVLLTRNDDSVQTDLPITLTDTSNPQDKPKQFTLQSKQTYKHNINISKPGSFTITASCFNGCTTIEKQFTFTVVARHVQYYDQLLLKGIGPNSSMECTSIVLREGDGLEYPVCMETIQNKSNLGDIKLYGSSGYARLLQLGHAILLVENTASNAINDLYIEMNPFIYLDDDNIDALVTEWNDGMLKNFVNNFYILNPNLKGLVEIVNLTEDNDVIEEEDVFLHIKKIQQNKQVYIKLPFIYKKTRLIHMEFLIMGQSTEIISLDDDTIMNDLILSVDDLISNELFITGNLDINDKQSCCQSDILYTIQNIDTIETKDQPKITQIINSPQIIPTAYKRYNDDDFIDVKYVDGVYQTDENDMVFTRKTEQKTIPLVNEEIVVKYLNKNKIMESHNVKTDSKGVAQFDYIIPEYFGLENYTIDSILQNLIQIEYNGGIEYRENTIGAKLQLMDPTIKILGLRINNDWITDFNTTIKTSDKINIYGLLMNIDKQPLYGIIDSNTEVQARSTICGIVEDDIVDNIDLNIYNNIINQYEDNFTRKYNKKTDLNIIKQYINKGLFKLPVDINKDCTITTLLQDYIYIRSRETALYHSAQLGNPKIIKTDDNRQKSILYVANNYVEYAPNSLITLNIHLNGVINTFKNAITIKQPLKDGKYSNQIRYKLCEEGNGIYQTTYKTNDTTLMPNDLSKTIYCNVPTELDVKAKLQKKVIEQNDLNTLLLTVTNGSKPNKDVKVLIYIGDLSFHSGDYDILEAINVDDGQYSYDEHLDVITWYIGDMESHQSIDGNIRLSAEALGENIVRIYAYDYLNQSDDLKTVYTFVSLLSEPGNYSVGDNIPLISQLSDIYTNLDSTEKIYFMDNKTNKILATATTKENEETNIREAKGYFQPIISGTFDIQARYAGRITDTSKYTSSMSEIITIPVSKVDTEVSFESDEHDIAVNTGAIIKVYLKHNNKIINSNDINVKYYVNNSQLISGITETKDYTEVHFVPTEIGQYVLHVVIEETDKYKGKTVDYIINAL